MSSINPHFTFEYSQPEDYRFSHDSVFLARHVFEHLQAKDISQTRMLDLCAGCGVVGLDLLFHLHSNGKSPAAMDFLEVQEIYRPHFALNKNNLNIKTELQFICDNYTLLKEPEYKNKYDVIVSNPPYFLPQQGKLSPSEFKNRCRFFLDASFSDLMLAIENALTPEGTAFVLVRPLKDHKIDLLQKLPPSLRIAESHNIRGTDVLHLRLGKFEQIVL